MQEDKEAQTVVPGPNRNQKEQKTRVCNGILKSSSRENALAYKQTLQSLRNETSPYLSNIYTELSGCLSFISTQIFQPIWKQCFLHDLKEVDHLLLKTAVFTRTKMAVIFSFFCNANSFVYLIFYFRVSLQVLHSVYWRLCLILHFLHWISFKRILDIWVGEALFDSLFMYIN